MNECIKLLLDESVIFIFDPAALPPQIAETAQLGIPSWAAWAIWAGRAARSKTKINEASRRSLSHKKSRFIHKSEERRGHWHGHYIDYRLLSERAQVA